mmetsp:Transcript_1409/g.4571  ORF Transcript_1409/g.4571 Transcript_1409/m.4571 type:complete len:252 (-) Transcript_1409:54-809(-)
MKEPLTSRRRTGEVSATASVTPVASTSSVCPTTAADMRSISHTKDGASSPLLLALRAATKELAGGGVVAGWRCRSSSRSTRTPVASERSTAAQKRPIASSPMTRRKAVVLSVSEPSTGGKEWPSSSEMKRLAARPALRLTKRRASSAAATITSEKDHFPSTASSHSTLRRGAARSGAYQAACSASSLRCGQQSDEKKRKAAAGRPGYSSSQPGPPSGGGGKSKNGSPSRREPEHCSKEAQQPHLSQSGYGP